MTKAIQVREDSIFAQEKEEISLAWNSLIVKKSTGTIENINKDNFEDELKIIGKNVEVTYDNNNNSFSIYFPATQHTHFINNKNELPLDNNFLLSKQKLYAYYDYNKYKDEKGQSLCFIGGIPTLTKNEGININMKHSSTYASIDISEKSDKSITIYMVVKAIEKNSDNARLLEVPKASSSGNTPSIFVTSSNTIGYGVFLNDKNSGISALDYNVIAIRLKKNENNSGGVMSTFINDTKYTDLNYNNRGNNLYLSYCTASSSGYGNNTYKMLAIYDAEHSDEQILENTQNLKNKYILNTSFSKLSSENLLEYYDFSALDNLSEFNKTNTWKNEIGNYGSMQLSTIKHCKIENECVNIDMKNKSTYASIDISEKSDCSLTIYMVAKAIEKNSDNARIIEIPKASSRGNTPTIHVTGSNTIGYGVFLNDKNSGISALDYNVIAIRLKKNENNSGGVMSTFINGTKYTDLNYNGRGNTVYLSYCSVNSRGYGNNNYKMLAIYDDEHTDDDIIENMEILKDNYIKN